MNKPNLPSLAYIKLLLLKCLFRNPSKSISFLKSLFKLHYPALLHMQKHSLYMLLLLLFYFPIFIVSFLIKAFTAFLCETSSRDGLLKPLALFSPHCFTILFFLTLAFVMLVKFGQFITPTSICSKQCETVLSSMQHLNLEQLTGAFKSTP